MYSSRKSFILTEAWTHDPGRNTPMLWAECYTTQLSRCSQPISMLKNKQSVDWGWKKIFLGSPLADKTIVTFTRRWMTSLGTRFWSWWARAWPGWRTRTSRWCSSGRTPLSRIRQSHKDDRKSRWTVHSCLEIFGMSKYSFRNYDQVLLSLQFQMAI